ncbi:LuxR family transcriptional regulator [Saccharothrix algeriensis]|uniref:Transcriptional regulator n=1 Tax=Catellatospora bangladeshensis TaxID=310355 RepID=A0A8J3JX05_9ACTN|nr:transcriptional regulator [Catellatospora bangladeshensis]
MIGAVAAAGEALVLHSAASATEAHLPYVALFDLLATHLDAADDAVPAHLAATLRAALLHEPPAAGTATSQPALRIAVVELLRALAERQPVLILLDDAQWLDPPSMEVLAFAVRRLGGSRIATLVTERVADGDEPSLGELCTSPTVEIPLGGLAETELAALLRTRLALRLHGSAMARITAASGGNPLFALELGRALVRDDVTPRPDEPLRVTRRLRDLVSDRLAGLAPALRPGLLMLAAGGPAPTETEASAALAEGVLVLGADGRYRFSHPMLSEIVYADATPHQRLAAHLRIADLTDDPVRHARHRALACSRPDAELAAALDRAADAARRRGAPGTAAELSRLAADRTPADPALAARRLLNAADSSHAAGLFADARADCERALGDADVEGRVSARLLLADLDADSERTSRLLADAAADAAGHPHLMARVHLYQADVAMRSGELSSCLADLEQAEALAGDSTELMTRILSVRGPVELFTDGARAIRTYRHGVRLTEGGPLTEAAVYLRAGLAVARLRQGGVSVAVRDLELLRGDVEAAGRFRELGDVLHVLTVAYERAGRCRQAYSTGLAGARFREDLEPNAGRALLLRGMAELNGGTAAAAASALEAAAAALEPQNMTESRAYSLGLLGRARYLQGDVGTAAALLARSRELLDGIGYVDPALFLLDADLAEALTRAGATEQAAHVLQEARARAGREDRTVVRLGLTRAEAVLQAARGEAHTAASLLRDTLGHAADHPYPLEVARAWASLGAIEAAVRRRAAARMAYGEAARRYARHGCTPWLRYVQAALDDLDGHGRPPTDLEQHIIDMVRAKATNRQIAAALHLSVKTVEAHLTRVYRMRGVRNRADLVSRLAQSQTPPR